MQKLRIAIVCCAVLLGFVLISGDDSAQARPQYNKAFQKKYTKVTEAKTKKCAVCHVGKKKKDRNNFGKALAKNIGKKQKDPKKIEAAFTKTEKEKSAIKDKTFGDLLKDGKLPASTK